MDERNFVGQKRETWQQLEAILAKSSKQGIKALTRDELRQLGSLYRRVASDLAFARNQRTSGDIEQHLNALVGRAHALLYEAEATPRNALQSTLNFYLYEFPALLQKRVAYFHASWLLFLACAIFGYWLVVQNEKNLDIFVPPQMKASVEYWKSGNVDAPASVDFSAQLMTHNFGVSLLEGVSGIAAGIPTLVLIFDNAALLGGMAGLMTIVGKHSTFWPGIVPHGISELTAGFICSTAGLLLGWTLLVPKPYSRAHSLKLHGMEAVKLILGTIPMFIFAGIIEGMFSRLPIPAGFRYAFALANGIMWYAYLFIPRRGPMFVPVISGLLAQSDEREN